MVDTSVNLLGIGLSNPVIPASGTFGYGYEFADFYDINILGSFSFKGTTLNPRYGNPTPRIAECSSGMLNSVGLQNPGVEKVISCELKKLKTVFFKPVMANVIGFSVEEYVKTATKKPVIIKLTPNITDITEIAAACEEAGADGLSLINTLLGMRIDLKTKKPVLKNVTGGLSGSAVFPVALRMVYQVYKTVKIPIVGMGGISSADDVIEMMLAGATAVEVGAANLIDPYACKKIIEDLPKAMQKYGINSLKDITGGAHNG